MQTLRAPSTDPNSEQERKKSDLIRQMKNLIEEVQGDLLFGEFTISFSAQAGKIGHFKEVRERTFR